MNTNETTKSTLAIIHTSREHTIHVMTRRDPTPMSISEIRRHAKASQARSDARRIQEINHRDDRTPIAWQIGIILMYSLSAIVSILILIMIARSLT